MGQPIAMMFDDSSVSIGVWSVVLVGCYHVAWSLCCITSTMSVRIANVATLATSRSMLALEPASSNTISVTARSNSLPQSDPPPAAPRGGCAPAPLRGGPPSHPPHGRTGVEVEGGHWQAGSSVLDGVLTGAPNGAPNEVSNGVARAAHLTASRGSTRRSSWVCMCARERKGMCGRRISNQPTQRPVY